MQYFQSFLKYFIDTGNHFLKDYSPMEIITLTVAVVIVYQYVVEKLYEIWKIGPTVVAFRFLTSTCLKGRV
jgi:hypothetical protein